MTESCMSPLNPPACRGSEVMLTLKTLHVQGGSTELESLQKEVMGLRESQQAQAARLSVFMDTTSTLITALQAQLTRILTGHASLPASMTSTPRMHTGPTLPPDGAAPRQAPSAHHSSSFPHMHSLSSKAPSQHAALGQAASSPAPQQPRQH